MINLLDFLNFLDRMKLFFRSIIPYFARIIPVPAFSNITYYRHTEDKFLYLCMSEEHITSDEKFLKIFSYAIRISRLEFDCIHYFFPDVEIVTIMDDKIEADILESEIENNKE